MSFSYSLFGLSIVLTVVQAVAALPWLMVVVLGRDSFESFMSRHIEHRVSSSRLGKVALLRPLLARRSGVGLIALAIGFVAVLLLGVLSGLALNFLVDRENLERLGRLYAAALHLQLAADLCIGVFALLLAAWPKGAAVALAAFREGIRQPMFLFILVSAIAFLVISPFIPYFTFGDDFLMLKELGFDVAMLAAVLFGVLAASMSISEEIEGRTAITLMSKPVSRRQFLLGKFVGIFLAAAVMTVLIGWCFDWILIYKRWFERMDPVLLTPDWIASLQSWLGTGPGLNFGRGASLWVVDAGETVPGLVLGLCQVMVLLSIAVALATRLPMVVNMVICLIVYFLGHLTPVLVQVSQNRLNTDKSGSPVFKMVSFVAQVFDTLLPSLEFFSTGPALITDQQLGFKQFASYVGYVGGYACLYTTIVLLIGLVLFEDRDLA